MQDQNQERKLDVDAKVLVAVDDLARESAIDVLNEAFGQIPHNYESAMDNGFASHPSFKLPRVPAGRYVTVHLRPFGKRELYEGIFETSGCEEMGTDNELYILRRVKAPREPAEFIKVPRRWQESGHLTVFEMRRDERYLPSEAST